MNNALLDQAAFEAIFGAEPTRLTAPSFYPLAPAPLAPAASPDVAPAVLSAEDEQ